MLIRLLPVPGRTPSPLKAKGQPRNLLDGGQGDSDSLIFDNAIHTLDSVVKLQNFEHVGLKNSSLVTLKEALVLTDGGPARGPSILNRAANWPLFLQLQATLPLIHC